MASPRLCIIQVVNTLQYLHGLANKDLATHILIATCTWSISTPLLVDCFVDMAGLTDEDTGTVDPWLAASGRLDMLCD